MELVTIKDYAESRHVTYEAVCKQVRQYKKKELKGHLSYQGRLIFLDENAVNFLDQHRMKRNIVLAPTSEEIQKTIKQLQADLQKAMIERDNLKDQIIALQDEKAQLIEYKAKNEHLQLIADKTQSELNQTTQELEQLKIDAAVTRTANDNLAKEIEQAKEELTRYKPTLFGLYRKI